MLKKIKNTICCIRNIIGDFAPSVGVVIGSGLGSYIDEIDIEFRINYSDIEGFPVSTVEGHKGELIFGQLEDRKVVLMNGRFHYYEGYTPQEVTYGIRIMKELGVEVLLLSNAAGGIKDGLEIGDIMIITDHLNFIPNPLIGQNLDHFGVRFPSMSSAYDKGLRETAWQSAMAMKSGVYAALTGPSYETNAEIRYLKTIGADAVGMSTAPEVIVANHCGMRVFAVSVITNICGSSVAPTHEEVIEAGAKASESLKELFNYIITYYY